MSFEPGRWTVLLWRCDLPTSAGTDWLDSTERRRAAAFHRADDRDRFVVGRSMLRALLGANLGLDPSAVPLGQQRGEAPTLTGPTPAPRLRWSVSHAGSLVVVALARRPVGVDVERADAGPAWVRQEALLKAGQSGGRPVHWRIARLRLGAGYDGCVAAPLPWRLRLVIDGPALP